MKTFIALVHKEKDSAYGVQFPDVPGCFSAADTLEELLPNANEALALYFEDEAPIDARDLEAISQDKGIADALAEGAFLIAVPLIQMAGRTERINMTIDAGLLAAIDKTCKIRGITRSGFLASLAMVEIAG